LIKELLDRLQAAGFRERSEAKPPRRGLQVINSIAIKIIVWYILFSRWKIILRDWWQQRSAEGGVYLNVVPTMLTEKR
jgi:hypothetical protein